MRPDADVAPRVPQRGVLGRPGKLRGLEGPGGVARHRGQFPDVAYRLVRQLLGPDRFIRQSLRPGGRIRCRRIRPLGCAEGFVDSLRGVVSHAGLPVAPRD